MSDLLFSVFDLWTVTVSRYSGVMAGSVFVLNKLKSRTSGPVKLVLWLQSPINPIAARNWAKDLHFWLTYHRIIPLNPVNTTRVASLFTDLLISPFRSSSARVENKNNNPSKLLEKKNKKGLYQ